jgi:hypothetical protein
VETNFIFLIVATSPLELDFLLVAYRTSILYCVTQTGRQVEETSTTSEKQSHREAMNVERPERITKRDSDSSEGGSSVFTNNVMPDTINDVDITKSSTAIVSVPRSSSDAKLGKCDLHKEMQKVTEIIKSDKRDASMGRDRRPRHIIQKKDKDMLDEMMGAASPRGDEFVSTGEKESLREARHDEWLERITRRDSESEGGSSACTNNMDDVHVMESSTVIVAVPRISTVSSLELNENLTPGAFAFSNEQGNLVRRIMGPITASMVEKGQTSPLSLMESEGPTSPPFLSEPRGPSAIDEQSFILGELAEASAREEELERRLQELQSVQKRAVAGTAIVENSSGGDHEQNEASSPSGRKVRRFLMGAAVALLLVVGVIIGVTIPLTTNNSKDSPYIESAVTPTQSPAPTKAPTAAPTACTSLDCLAEILLQNEVADAEALQDDSSPQFQALRWLANNDTAVLDLDRTSPAILVERYVLAVFYFTTSGEGWGDQHNFLSGTSVCEWNTGSKGVLCNRDEMVADLDLRKSKHGEVIDPSEVGEHPSLTKLSLWIWIRLS